MSWEVPESWVFAPLGAVTADVDQRVPEAAEHFQYIDIASIDRNSKVISSPQALTGANAPSRARKSVRTDDVLVSMTRPNLNAVAQVPPELDGQIASTGFDVLRAKGVDPRWIYYTVRSLEFVQAMTDLVQGALYPAIRSKDVRDFELPLAPLAEQKRITDKLDSVLARVDAVNNRLARVAPLLKRFRQSVLAAATAGKLTSDWRGEESTAESWQTIHLGAFADNHDGARVPIAEKLRAKRRGEYPYYGASGAIDTIDGFTHEGKFLLIGEDGANLVARSKPIAFIAEGKIWVNNHAHVLKCKNGAPEEYLAYYINSIDLTPYVSGSAQPKLNQKNMNTIPVPVPPIKEQLEIVRRVKLLFAFADRLETRLQSAQTAAERLTPALLVKAFRGELVPQDPNDEPAAEMLRRLKENQSSPAAPAKKGRESGKKKA